MDEQVPAMNTELNAPEQQAPKMLHQDEVNKIVAREKSQAREAGRREAQQQHQQELEALNAQRTQQAQRNAEVPREFDADAMYQQFTERLNKETQERQLKEQMTQVANNYLSNISQGKASYEDFDEITKDFDPTAFPQVTYLLSGNPNAADVLYDLSKNPSKLVMIDNLAAKNPRMAQNELNKLSKSIQDNKQAQADSQGQNVAEPLDRLTPSRVSGSNGEKSISDLRSLPWMRG